MPRTFLFDTDVLIEYLRGKTKIIEYLENFSGEHFISSITVAELFAGVRDEEEKSNLEKFILAFKVIPVDLEISKTGGLFQKEYGKTHGTGLADALIAATAYHCKATMVTLNQKHYRMLEHLQSPQ